MSVLRGLWRRLAGACRWAGRRKTAVAAVAPKDDGRSRVGPAADDLTLNHPHGRELGAGVLGPDTSWVGEATREMPTQLLREHGITR